MGQTHRGTCNELTDTILWQQWRKKRKIQFIFLHIYKIYSFLQSSLLHRKKSFIDRMLDRTTDPSQLKANFPFSMLLLTSPSCLSRLPPDDTNVCGSTTRQYEDGNQKWEYKIIIFKSSSNLYPLQ